MIFKSSRTSPKPENTGTNDTGTSQAGVSGSLCLVETVDDEAAGADGRMAHASDVSL
jgi:hypothetical protein